MDHAGAKAGEGPASKGGSADLAKHLLDHIEAQIRAADTKALFIATANAFLVSSLTNLVGRWETVDKSQGGAVLWSIPVFMALTFLALLTSLYFALKTVKPRLTPAVKENLHFFSSISGHDEDLFIAKFKQMTDDVAHGSILAQVHAKSRIATEKYAGIGTSVRFLSAGLVLYGAVVIVYLINDAVTPPAPPQPAKAVNAGLGPGATVVLNPCGEGRWPHES